MKKVYFASALRGASFPDKSRAQSELFVSVVLGNENRASLIRPARTTCDVLHLPKEASVVRDGVRPEYLARLEWVDAGGIFGLNWQLFMLA